MSREIKFRGMTVKGEFVYGSLVNTTCGLKNKPKQHTKTWIVSSSFGNGGWFNIQKKNYVKPETVGQYIGLIDAKGNDIYEGDLLSVDNGARICKVYWNKYLSSFDFEVVHFKCLIDDFDCLESNQVTQRCCIISNIYNNN